MFDKENQNQLLFCVSSNKLHTTRFKGSSVKLSMEFVQIWLICLIVVTETVRCETIMNNSSNMANRRQQDLIGGSMDPSIEPCEDFYQYSCGNWKNFYTGAGDKFYETITLLDYKSNMEMIRVFNSVNLQSQLKFVKIAYQMFMSCSNLKEYEIVNYLNWLKETEDMKFPPLGRTRQKPAKYDWSVMMAKMRIYGMNGVFIQESVIQRNEDPSKFIMFLYKPDVQRDRFTPLTKDDLEVVLKSLGESPNILKLWHEVEAFELDLKELLAKNYDRYEVYDEDWPLKKIKDISVPWIKNYIKILLNQTELNPNMEIYLQDVHYFMAIEEFVKEHSQRFVCKYLEIRFLLYLLPLRPPTSLAEDCVIYTKFYLPMTMSWLYQQQHPDLELEFPKIVELYEDIRKIFNKSLMQNDYRFNETLVNFLLAKVNTMQLKLDNIPHTDTVQTLEKLFDNLELNTDEFYANHLKLLKFNFVIIHNQAISNTTQQMDYFLDEPNIAASSGPHYIRRFNIVVLPSTFLQQPIYQPNSDNVYKYSSLGFVLAQSMFQGFTRASLEFDHKGVRLSQSYEDILTNPLFKEKIVNCLLETNPSQRENKIADISALSYAYQLFNDSTPDDIDVSQRKLFFLNFAQYFCDISNSEGERLTDTLTYFPEFSKVFQCNSSHRMYPQPTLCDIGGY